MADQPIPSPVQPVALIDADALVNTYLDQVPCGRELANRDPVFNHHLTWLRTILPAVDHTLRTDGINTATRQRVANTLVYGTPDTEQAVAEIQHLDTVLNRLQASLVGDRKPGHQFTGVLGRRNGPGRQSPRLPEVGGHASSDATVHDLPPLPDWLVQRAAEADTSPEQ